MSSLRDKTHELLERPDPKDPTCRLIDAALIGVISVNVAGMMLESDPSLAHWRPTFAAIAVLSVIAFTLEYVLRLWSAPTDARFAGSVRGRVRFAAGLFPIIDLLSIAPFHVAWWVGEPEMAGLVRVVWLAKLGRHSQSLRVVGGVLRAQRRELFATGFVLAVLLAVASCAAYLAEHDAQPEVFRTIPATLWWSVVTMTTVGYGDAVPVTTAGKLVGSAVAILGVLAIAIPTSILGSGFHAALRSQDTRRRCPHCGEQIHSPTKEQQ